MSLRLLILYCSHVFEILHFSENAFLLLHPRSNIRGLRTVQGPDFYLCLLSVLVSVGTEMHVQRTLPRVSITQEF